MALVLGKRAVSGMRRSSNANVCAAIENQLMPKVLLIEDDSETAEEITAELAERGFEVEWSADGIQGLDQARSSRPDAMIVDRLLPGMDGLTVIEALRQAEGAAAPAGRIARDHAPGRAAGTRSDRANRQTRRSRDRPAATRISIA